MKICSITFGLQTKDKSTYVAQYKKEDDWEKCYTGKDIQRYSLSESTLYFKNNFEKVKAGGSWDMDKHHSKKIVVRQVGNPEPIFAFDKYGYASLNTMYNIVLLDNSFSENYLLSVLNSSFTKYYFLSKYSDGKQLFPKIKGYQLKELPIPNISQEAQQPFINLANQMLSLNEEFSAKKNRFLRRLEENFKLDKLTKKLENFYEFDFSVHKEELKKKKIELSFKQQDEWQDYFEEYKKDLLALQHQIQTTDNQIDNLVFELYGLSEEEIRLIKEV